jgi:hypothetical protein
VKSASLTVISAVLISLLAACNGSENSVTGPSAGNGVLSGQVLTVGDLAGASPSGITVTAGGFVAVTDASGRFSFIGLSSASTGLAMFNTAEAMADRQISFSRADGISASANVAANAAEVVVHLQKKQASIQVTGQAKREIEGLIVEVSSSSITVNDARTGGPVKATINSSTVIRKGNQSLTAADLKAGDRVHVKAEVMADGSFRAFEIMLQNSGTDNGNGNGQTKELEGLILAVSASSITVNNASTGGPVTAAITGSTVIRKGNTRLTAADLKVGQRVHVKTTGSGDSLTATEIIVQGN